MSQSDPKAGFIDVWKRWSVGYSLASAGCIACLSAANATPVLYVEATYNGATTPLVMSGAPNAEVTLSLAGFDGLSAGTVSAELKFASNGPVVQASSTPLDSQTGTLTSPLHIIISAVGLIGSRVGNFSTSNSYGLQTDSTASYAAYYDPNNGTYSEADLLTSNSLTGMTDTPSSASYNSGPTAETIATSLYSMTEEIDVTVASDGGPEVSGNIQFKPVSEPAAASLMILGLVALGMLRSTRRLRRPLLRAAITAPTAA